MATRLPANDVDVKITIFKGIKNKIKRNKITFECNKNADYFFTKIKKLIAAAYNKVSKISFFNFKYKKAMQVFLIKLLVFINDLLRQVFINTNTVFLALF